VERFVRLKTADERRRDIERELDFLDHQKQAAKREYDRRLADIEAQRERVLKRLRSISKEGVRS
jgi:hypothetical protein